MKSGRNKIRGKWNGNQSCPDPMELFESIVFKLDDLVERTSYEFFDVSVEKNVGWQNSTNQKLLWSKIDVSIVPGMGSSTGFGRCFTSIPTIDHTKYGIKRISLKLKKASNVYFHTPGTFQSANVNIGQSVSLGKIVELDVIHELFNR